MNDGFLQGQTTSENLPVKRFGYILSAFFLILANIALYKNWPATPWLFLITMYFLTGSLWIPALIKPFYNLLVKKIFRSAKKKNSPPQNNSHELPNKTR